MPFSLALLPGTCLLGLVASSLSSADPPNPETWCTLQQPTNCTTAPAKHFEGWNTTMFTRAGRVHLCDFVEEFTPGTSSEGNGTIESFFCDVTPEGFDVFEDGDKEEPTNTWRAPRAMIIEHQEDGGYQSLRVDVHNPSTLNTTTLNTTHSALVPRGGPLGKTIDYPYGRCTQPLACACLICFLPWICAVGALEPRLSYGFPHWCMMPVDLEHIFPNRKGWGNPLSGIQGKDPNPAPPKGGASRTSPKKAAAHRPQMARMGAKKGGRKQG